MTLVLNGDRVPSEDLVDRIAKALNMDVPTKAGTKARAS